MYVTYLHIQKANHQSDGSDDSSSNNEDNDQPKLQSQPPALQQQNNQLPALWNLQCFLTIMTTMLV